MTAQTELPPSAPADNTDSSSRWPAAVSGIAASAAALSAGELLGAFFAPSPGPVIAVANRVIDWAPTWFVEFGKGIFGLSDKPALIVGTVIISLVIGAAMGLASRRDKTIGAAVVAAFGLVGLVAIVIDPQGTLTAGVIVALTAVTVGVAVLYWLMPMVEPHGSGGGLTTGAVTEHPTSPAVSRRSFLNWAGVTGVATAITTRATAVRFRCAAAAASSLRTAAAPGGGSRATPAVTTAGGVVIVCLRVGFFVPEAEPPPSPASEPRPIRAGMLFLVPARFQTRTRVQEENTSSRNKKKGSFRCTM